MHRINLVKFIVTAFPSTCTAHKIKFRKKKKFKNNTVWIANSVEFFTKYFVKAWDSFFFYWFIHDKQKKIRYTNCEIFYYRSKNRIPEYFIIEETLFRLCFFYQLEKKCTEIFLPFFLSAATVARCNLFVSCLRLN